MVNVMFVAAVKDNFPDVQWIKPYPEWKAPLPRACESDAVLFSPLEIFENQVEENYESGGLCGSRNEVLDVLHLALGGPDVPDVLVLIGVGDEDTAEAWLRSIGFEYLSERATFQRMGLGEEYSQWLEAQAAMREANGSPTIQAEGADATKAATTASLPGSVPVVPWQGPDPGEEDEPHTLEWGPSVIRAAAIWRPFSFQA